MAPTIRQEPRLVALSDAIRKKSNWTTKILDPSRNLGRKWAEEAGLWDDSLTTDPEQHASNEQVQDLLHGLKTEARRIRILDQSIRLTTPHLPARDIAWDRIEEDVKRILMYANHSANGVRARKFPGDPKVGVCEADGLVPMSLHTELVKELDALAAIEPKDFHPGTGGKVQDLIHPSLYPYIANKTPVHPGTTLPTLTDDGNFSTRMSSYNTFSEDFISSHAWIPSVFQVNEDATDARIETYINGLGPRERFPNLYRLIEKMFVICMPNLDQTFRIADEFEAPCPTPSETRWMDRGKARQDGDITRKQWEDILAASHEERKKEEEARLVLEREIRDAAIKEWKEDAAAIMADEDDGKCHCCDRFKGKKAKVIVKAANYVLKPGQEYEGSWHIEGMPHERVTASAIYYYETHPSLSDQGLGLRRFRDEDNDFPTIEAYNWDSFIVDPKMGDNVEDDEEEEDDEDKAPEKDWPSDWEVDQGSYPNMQMHIPLGTVPTTNSEEILQEVGYGTGRIVSFPNWIQHKVLKLKNEGTETATRKILCFFLVEDDDQVEDDYRTIFFPGFTYYPLRGQKVLTTSEVPIQGRQTNTPTLHSLLPAVCRRLTGENLPAELVDLVVELGELGITTEEAERNRRRFMEERKTKGAGYGGEDIWDTEFSLCEH